MQDGFVKLFANLKRYNPDKGTFDAWLSRVVINNILSEKRKKRVDRNYIAIDSELSEKIEDTSDDILDSSINSEDLLLAIRKLPEKYRIVLNLFIFDKVSHREIGILLNIEESSSRSRFTRAKRLLKQILLENSSILICTTGKT